MHVSASRTFLLDINKHVTAFGNLPPALHRLITLRTYTRTMNPSSLHRASKKVFRTKQRVRPSTACRAADNHATCSK